MANYPPKTYQLGWEAHRTIRSQVKQVLMHGFHMVAHYFVFAAMQGQASALEPDMLVVGLQEADLSTEAFFNFTGSAREDAWTVAILAALGDKTERYEKVSFLAITAGTCS